MVEISTTQKRLKHIVSKSLLEERKMLTCVVVALKLYIDERNKCCFNSIYEGVE